MDVLQHGETNARATGVHAAILAPDSVRVLRHTSGSSHHRRQDPMRLALPAYDPATTVVLFPASEVRQLRSFGTQ